MTQRYDVSFGPQDGAVMYIEPHFCREGDEDGGCYGTSMEHGVSFEAACEQVARWHEDQAKAWRDGTHHLQQFYGTQHKGGLKDGAA